MYYIVYKLIINTTTKQISKSASRLVSPPELHDFGMNRISLIQAFCLMANFSNFITTFSPPSPFHPDQNKRDVVT
jgi:hypothetical protein